MRPRNLVAVFLSAALCSLAPMAAWAADARPEPGANAALQYWTAFALLPTLDKDQEKLLENWNTVPFDAAALKLIDKSQYSRLYLHLGAARQRCDFSPDYDQGIRLLLPHLSKARTLARLTALHARHEFELGHGKTGAEDIAALFKLGRHLKMDLMFIPNLVGCSIESMAIEAAAPHLVDLKSILPEIVSSVINAPSTDTTLPQLVQIEKRISAQWLIQEMKAAEQRKPGSWQNAWTEIFGGLTRHGEHGDPDKVPLEAAKSYEQAVKLLEDLLPLYDELARIAALPWKEFDAAYPEFIKKARAVNVMAAYVLPAADEGARTLRRTQTHLALFKAAMAVVQGGQDKLKDFQDPFGDGPFEYRALDKGFELKSKLIVKDQPLTLVVGKKTD